MIVVGSKVTVKFPNDETVTGVVDKVSPDWYRITYKANNKEWVGLFRSWEVIEDEDL